MNSVGETDSDNIRGDEDSVPGGRESERSSSRQIATVVSEVGGPAPVLFVGLLEIGFQYHAVVPAVVAAVTMAVIPYAALLMLERSRKVTDRFVRDRKQRTPILLGTLGIFAVGAVVVVLMGAPAELTLAIGAAIAGLIIVTCITLVWKISVHATITAFFVGLQVSLFGPWGLPALIILALVLWSRLALRAHTAAQLAAGTALGAGLAVLYMFAVHLLG